MKTAVILFNLGGPDSKASIRPFLFNFFMDPNIVRLPNPFRWFLAKYISITRSKREAGKSYHALGNVSPILENSRAQAEALEKLLGSDFKVFISMRYWHPMALDVIPQINKYRPERLVLLPLYPQFSTTTVRSSFQDFWASVQQQDGWLHAEWDDDVKVSGVCCYPINDGFIKASVENISAVLAQAKRDGHEDPRVLFSAHGLPESVIRDGDPYQWQCEEGAGKIANILGIEDWAICYQSRVGAQKWIGPSTEEELRRASKDGKAVVIYPHAFTQEHVETLVEIEIEYRELAHALGIKGFYRAPTVSTHPAFIEGLAGIVKDHANKIGMHADGEQRVCPVEFKRCCMNQIQRKAA
jgi:protoporphyrin/coproporphyrin ferrochelatase